MSQAWVIRSGKHGERDQWALENAVSGGGWREVPDLGSCTSRDDIERVVREVYGAKSPGLVASYTGQLWALTHRVEVGDLLVMPMKTTRELAMGRVMRTYYYRTDEPDQSRRHVVGVAWSPTTIPRTAVKQDLLYTLGSAISIFSPSRHNAAARLEHLAAHGEDPGELGLRAAAPSTDPSPLSDASAVDQPEATSDVEQVAIDQITIRIGEEFSGHDFAHLVAELLRVEGFVTDEAPPGADGGIDITAGRGVLGVESPRLIVQVKTGKVASEVISQLNGLVMTHGADFGLIVTWAGLTGPARDTVKHQRFKVKVWDSTDVIDGIFKNYDRLPDAIRSRLPLKQVWILRDE